MKNWVAYCKQCQVDIGNWPNGKMVEAQASLHVEGNPDHEVIVGFLVRNEVHHVVKEILKREEEETENL